MSKFCSLFSSSDGNSTFLASNKTRILIDAGVSNKKLCAALTAREIKPESIDAIFITHEHIDHIKAIKVFCTKYETPIYATKGTIEALVQKDVLNGKFIAYEMTPGSTVEIGDLKVTSFKTPHDSNESCCYTVEFPDERVATVATDIGHITDEVHNALLKSDLVLLESNYDPNMLMTGFYPYDVKKRISSDTGHLPNDECAKECVKLLANKTTRFFLGHLSKNNNMPALAYETTASEIAMNGGKIGIDCLLEVCKIEGDGKIIRF